MKRYHGNTLLALSKFSEENLVQDLTNLKVKKDKHDINDRQCWEAGTLFNGSPTLIIGIFF